MSTVSACNWVQLKSAVNFTPFHTSYYVCKYLLKSSKIKVKIFLFYILIYSYLYLNILTIQFLNFIQYSIIIIDILRKLEVFHLNQ